LEPYKVWDLFGAVPPQQAGAPGYSLLTLLRRATAAIPRPGGFVLGLFVLQRYGWDTFLPLIIQIIKSKKVVPREIWFAGHLL